MKLNTCCMDLLLDKCLPELFTYPCVNALRYCECFPETVFGYWFIKTGISCMNCISCQIH